MSNSKVTTEQFVVLYMQRGGDLVSISNQLGVGKASVYQRVKKLRKAGVKLPLKRRAANSYDVKGLNNIIKQYRSNNA